MRFLCFLAYLLVLRTVVSGNIHFIHKYASTIRPPAFPLAVRSPYVNVWLTHNTLPEYWPLFRNGKDIGWTGIARVDEKAYTFMGSTFFQHGSNRPAIQKTSFITPTKTIFILQTGPVELQVTFLSPVEPNDLKRQSIPMSYVFIKPKSLDGALHKVQIYMDISGQWVNTDVYQQVNYTLFEHSNIKTWKFQLTNQVKYRERDQHALWGAAYFSSSGNAMHQSGSHIDLRRQFSGTGSPSWLLHMSLIKWVQHVKEKYTTIGHARDEINNFRGTPQKVLWTHYFADDKDMAGFFFHDSVHAKEFSDDLDDRLLTESYAVGGQDYADIISLSLRQAVAGFELSGTPENPLLYLDDERAQNVDVLYSIAPMWYYLNVTYLEYLLEPLFQYNEFRTETFAMGDICLDYPPIAQPCDNPTRINKPIEETANMIFMVANLCLHPTTDLQVSQAYINKHFDKLKTWAEYLYINSLNPAKEQLQLIGETERNTGLALKGIMALKAYNRLAKIIGKDEDKYNVEKLVRDWLAQSHNIDGSHLTFEYGRDGSYQLKHDTYQDKLMNLQVVPKEVYKREAAFYLTKLRRFGIFATSTVDKTKSDWEIWTATAFGDAEPYLKTNLLNAVTKYLQETSYRVPFSDWYNPETKYGFPTSYANPAVGGHFALLAYKQSNQLRNNQCDI